MTIIEKAYKVRNLWNRWNDYAKQENVLGAKIDKLDDEMEKATYSKNGYQHFKVFGAYLDPEGAVRQRSYLVQNYERVVGRMQRIEKELEGLLTN